MVWGSTFELWLWPALDQHMPLQGWGYLTPLRGPLRKECKQRGKQFCPCLLGHSNLSQKQEVGGPEPGWDLFYPLPGTQAPVVISLLSFSLQGCGSL